MNASYWRKPVINVTKPIEDRVLSIIKNKYEGKEVKICDSTDIKVGSKNGTKKIIIVNKYDSEMIYAKFHSVSEYNAFISGYYSCWSDTQ